MPYPIEKRRAKRDKSFLMGNVFDTNGNALFDVVVIDISPLGAQLFSENVSQLPQLFDLQITRRKAIFRCSVVRVVGETAGVKFC